MKLGAMAIDMAEFGAQVDRVRMSFEGLAQADATPMIEGLRQASRGAIDDMNLMLSANKAMMLGVTQNADEMTRLLEIATVRGRAMGLSTQQAFNDIVTGIGRMSPLILDNLGIMTGGARTFEEYAAAVGKAADELSDLEKRQALLNKVLQDTSKPVDDAAQGFEALGAQAKNLKASWAVGMGGALGPIAQEIADFTASALQSQEILGPYTDTLSDMKAHMPTAEYQALRAEVYAASKAWDAGALSVEEYKARLNELIPGIDKTTIVIQAAETATLRKEQADLRAAAAAREHGAAEVEKAAKIRAGIAAGYAAGLDPWLVRRAHDPSAGAGLTVQEQIRRDEEALREAESAAAAALRGVGGGGISDAQRLAEQRQREFQSLVESALQPTQVTGADVSATEHGAYQDKWDEEMRRLRAREDIPYYQRAETERQFYSGQLPEMVNWDAMIADIARRQQEESGRRGLLDEAMRRAQEAGLTANYADVAAAMGIRDEAVLGLEAGEAFETGVQDVNVAATVTEQFAKQMRAQRQTYVDLGAEIMHAMLEGTDEGITPDVGKRFAKRIFPYIYDELEAQGILSRL
jgi:hypothetical protein